MAEAPHLRDALRAIVNLEGELARTRQREREPIAVVGLSMRTPFESQGVAMWEGLSKGIDASQEVPRDRWGTSDVADPDHKIRRGSFLSNTADFDASFFAIAPVEAQAMDPQQRMVLETVWESLADAGANLAHLQKLQVGVFLGACANEYSELSFVADLPTAVESYLSTGNSPAVIAGRVSYALGLTGPSFVVDTACSSSLVALHLACESLRVRTSDVALAGGVNLIISPQSTGRLAKLGALSTDGRCRTFDATGSGYGRGEGCGIVVLKRLSDAVRDGDRILAQVRGSAVNQDGRSDGLTAPSGLAQQRVIRSALEFAKLTPADVQYVEAHGTGTVLGDPIEVEALNEVFGAAHTKSSPLAIGSVKSNIGHLEGAAGISGLVKTILCIQHRELPPSIHFQTPNPHIPWEHIPLRVQTELGPWPEPSKPLVAGLSSFGFSGTNVHVVVSEPPAAPADAWKDADRLAAEAKLLPLCVSAKTPEALQAYAERFAKYLSSPLEPPATWRDVAFTSNARRTHLEHRLVVLGGSAAEWSEKLAAVAKGEKPGGAVTGDATSPVERAVFVFSGQGTQWWGMGRELLEREPVFRATLEECASHIRKHADWSLLEELGRDESTSRLHRTDIAQPALVSLQMGLVRLLASWGVEPTAVVGHSVGEIAAACAAGVLTLEQACHVATVRGRVMHKASGQGKMASVRLSGERAEALARDFPGRLVVGAYNGPESVVLSGEAAAVESALAMLEAQGVETKELRVDYAFHSPQMDPFMSELGAALSSLKPAAAQLPIVSTVTGTASGSTFDGAYWVRQMREPVKFTQATRALFDQGYDLFVELGAHPVLLASIDETSSQTSKRPRLVATLRRNGGQSSLVETLGALHCAGYPVNWEKVLGGRGRVVSLPSYPWQRERHWLPAAKKAKRLAADSKWALLHARFAPSDQPDKHIFQLELDLKEGAHAYLADHVVQGGVWLPGAAFLEMALEVGAAAFEGRDVTLEDVKLSQALMISEGEVIVLQLILSPEQEGTSGFRISSRLAKDSGAAWIEHASGRLALDRARSEGGHAMPAEAQQRCAREAGTSAFYEGLATTGFVLGPAFKVVERAWIGDKELLSKLVPLEKLTEHVSGYVMHPLLLDAGFQSAGLLAISSGGAGTYVPSTMGSVRVFGNAVPRWAHLTLHSITEGSFECDIRLMDDRGQLAAEVKAMRGVALGRGSDKLDEWLFEQAWRSSASKAVESVDGRWLVLADEQGVASGLRTWLEARGAEVVTATRGAVFTKKDATHYVVDPLDPASMVRLLKEAFGKTAPKRIVHLSSLDTRDAAESALDERAAQRAQDLACTSILHLVQALSQTGWSEPPRLFVVTRSCQAATGSRDVRFPEQALAWGFGASLVHEMPELQTTLVDLDATSGADALAHELVHADDENRIALRGSERLAPRLVRHARPKKVAGALRPLTVGAAEGYRLDALEPGRLDSLTLRPAAVPTPGPGEVVIRTHASGLDLRDVMIAQGTYSGLGEGRLPMGSECAGVVHAVGAGVETLRVGDAVVAASVHGFDAYVVVSEELVVKKPASLSFEQAASLPSSVMTALYALERAGRLRKGERLLIHAATEGVGLAAVQYAKHVGAEIHATADSEEKRAYLRSLGVAHVYDSRTLAWADEVKRDTGGRGVDLVLNSLPGEARLKGASVLAPFGRFLELGKRDASADPALDLFAMRSNITITVVAREQLVADRPAESRALLEETFRLVEDGVLSPLPLASFPVSRVTDAFEHLSLSRHVGKVVVTAEERVSARDSARSDQVQSDKTYLVTGGLGGLGLVVAKRLAKLGARHVALMGRSAPSDGAKLAIGELEASGVHVYVVRADVGERSAVASALAELARSAPPVAGVVHAAGVLDDGIVSSLTAARIGTVLAPKVLGALALDGLLPDLTMRVYFSSVAGVMGSAGQAHYAAANAFLDAFAHHIASRSAHALSLDWGAWGEVGLAARPDRADNVARQGLAVLSPDDGAELFERVLGSTSAQLTPMPIDFRQWRQANPRLAGMPLLREMLASSSSSAKTTQNAGLFDRLREAPSEAERIAVLEDYLRTIIAAVLRSKPDAVSRSKSFKQMGFDSLMMVSLKNTLERDLGLSFSTAILFTYPSVDRLATFITAKLKTNTPASQGAAPRVDPASAQPAEALDPGSDVPSTSGEVAVEGLEARSPATTPDHQAVAPLLGATAQADRRDRGRHEPIAIVGLGSRMPFEAQGVTMWEGLSKGVDASREIPPDRWDADAFYDTDPRAPNKAIAKRASFLSDVTQFDASFFAIAPVEAQAMDPQQRIVLETAWEALADAGTSLASLRERRTGVFLGVCAHDYDDLVAASDTPAALAPYLATGNASSVVAGRVSYALGLTGPCFVVDTACSSSLVALHLACESLRVGTSDVALTGGVNLILSPRATIKLSKFGGLSPDGRCRSFDAMGSGFGRGEGCGIVVLKRLSDAVRDGDRVLAVVRGSAVNQDGRSDGLTAPNGLSQQEVIRSALEVAKLTPADVQYVEAHGTGTVLGDPIEVDALSEVFGAGHTKSSPLAIGSVKSNIGHLEGAAGISGLLKIILSIQHRELPPTVHFQTPNPHIPWEDIPVRVQTKLGPWPEPNKPLVAGVSSFAFSGTNAHVVVSEPPAAPADAWKDADRLAAEAKLLPLCVSAKTPEALRAYAERFAKYLSSPLDPPATWRDVAFTSSVRGAHLEHRVVVVGASAAEWSEKLASFAKGERPSGVVTRDATSPVERAVFVFSGQGTQWWGMGRELLEREPVFRATLEECASHIRKYAEWSLLEELGRDEGTSRLHRTDIAQPALMSLQMGLVRLLASWGVEPSAVVGHSVGEIAAACAAGVLTLEQACHVATVRGRVMHKASGQGKMASVRLSGERAEALVRDFPGRLVVGAYNGPESVVLSGEPAAVDSALAMLEAQGVETKELRVDYAFHSPQMDPFMSELGAALSSLKPRAARVPIVSTVTGTASGSTFDGAYWVRQMREPVKFTQATQTLLDREQELFVELGAHPVLLASIDETASQSQSAKRPRLVSTLRRKDDQALCVLEALGAIHCAGYPVEWKKRFSVPGRVVSLPSYPWQRERYWLPLSKKTKGGSSASKWALIHSHMANSDQPGKHVFEVELELDDGAYAYFADHVVQGGVWLPGAAFLEMALQGAGSVFEGRDASVEDVALSQALMISKGEAVVVQLVLSPEQEGASGFRIASRSAKEETATWTEHATGRIVLGRERGGAAPSTLVELQKRCSREVDAGALYDDFVAMGISYGAAFQGIEQAWSGAGEALSKLAPVEKLTEHVNGYVVHPSLLDAAFQTLAVAAQKEVGAGRTYVPQTVGSLHVVGKGAPRWAHVKLRSATDEAVECDVSLLDERGGTLAEVKGLRAVALGRGTDKLDEWLFEQAWRPSVSKAPESVDGRWLLLADEQGVASVLRTWLEARGAEVVTVTRGAGYAKKDATHYVVDPLEPASILRLMKEAYGKSAPKRIVHLSSLDARDTAASALDERGAQRAQDLTCTSSLHLVQALSQMGWSEPPRLFMVTRGCQAANGSRDVRFPEQALAWGFGASVVHEMPELQTTLVDLDATSGPEALAQELVHADDENRVALRGTERLVPRLVRHVRPKKLSGALRPLTVGTTEGYRLDPVEPGRVESLTLQPTVVPTPGPGEVVVRTRASGVNFRDVLMALGMYPGLGDGRLPMGGECAGVVHAVGDGVETLRVGDAVVAMSAHAFDAYVVVSEELVVKKPASLSFEQAASLPSVVMTVLYALDRVGRLRKGERILIHAATGGVGLAAVQYAKHVGAEIYATAGSEEKRAYLRSLGVTNVYDSRTLAWADEVKRDTGGRGVDVVLNSLAGQALLKGVAALAPFGRFLELGKRDIYENSSLGLYGIRNNVMVSAVALDQLAQERPAESRELLEQTFRLVEDGALSALPVESFPVSRAADAFEHLSRARHIGKVVLTAEDTVTVRDPARSDQVQSDKTYLVTGGLGGLGLVVAKRLAKLGAQHVALMGRSAPSESAKAAIGELEASGVHVYVVRADVGERRAVASALAELARSAPPVAGVVHAAGVLDDATLSSLSAARIGPVLGPKVLGALVLDGLLPDLSMRVYFSSVAGLLGSAGQAHYAAANAFLDAFAQNVASRSTHALSLDWGAWGEVGLAARVDRQDNVARQGLALLSPEEGADLFERLLSTSAVQLAPMPIDFRQWRQANPQVAGMPILREVIAASGQRAAQKNTGLFDRLRKAASESARLAIIDEYLRLTVASILRSSVDAVPRSAPFKQLGFDSLMTVSLKNTLERDLAISISAAVLFKYPSVERLVVFLASKIEGPTDGKTEVVPAISVAEPVTTRTVEKLDPSTATDGELRARLAERLHRLEREVDDD